MKFINSSNRFPFSDAVIYSGWILETVLTGIPPGEEWPLKGGVKEELQEIFRQLDSILAQAGATKTSVVSARLSQMLTGILSLSTRFTKSTSGLIRPIDVLTALRCICGRII
jgi:hypothetical protein